MIYATPGSTFEARFDNVPSGVKGVARWRLDDNDGTVTAPATTGIEESPAGSGSYIVTGTAPAEGGQYAVVFDTGVLTPSTAWTHGLTVNSTGTPDPGPSGSDLTTIAKAKLVLRDDAADDTLLQLYVTAYSQAVNQYCDRRFRPLETAAAKKFRYDGSGVLSLAPYELRTLTTLEMGTDLAVTSQTTLDAQTATLAADYRLEPRDASSFFWVALPAWFVSSRYRNAAAQITVTGDWGADPVPADVELACLVAVANGYRNPESFASRSLEGFTVSEAPEPDGQGMSLPSDARGLLDPYRRLFV